ncbi:hypothetical protein DPMN_073660 [Dreissena polymorpha]|uniref:Uncharacterized protein n=1 Tax=Dreissena polymorpha TaxID=45954 RepID=A0A9D4BZH2_DREPO|nr:hypothetical protein DPMN_073660 [Dreissena polymorpha]
MLFLEITVNSENVTNITCGHLHSGCVQDQTSPVDIYIVDVSRIKHHLWTFTWWMCPGSNITCGHLHSGCVQDQTSPVDINIVDVSRIKHHLWTFT